MLSQIPFIQFSSSSINLPFYSGKGDDLSFARWYVASVEELRAFGFQNEEQIILLMARQLKGNARQIYDSYKNENEDFKFTSLETFRAELESKFIDDNFDIKLRYKLLSLKQGENISKYIEEEKNIYGNYKNMYDKDRIFYLMNNMKPSYVNILIIKNPASFADAISLLIHHGDVISMNSNMSKDNNRDSEDDDAMEIDAILCKELDSNENINLKPGKRAEPEINYFISGKNNVPRISSKTESEEYLPVSKQHDDTKSNENVYKYDSDSGLNFQSCSSVITPEEETINKKRERPLKEKYFLSKKILLKSLSELPNLQQIETGQLKNRNSSTPIWKTKINDIDVSVLLDSGASRCFMSAKAATNLNLIIKDSELKANAVTADGLAYEIKKQANFCFKIGGMEFPTTAYIFPLKSVDVILGYDWWIENKLQPCYDNNKWFVTKNTNTIYLQEVGENETIIISSNALNRLIKNNEVVEISLVHINEIIKNNISDLKAVKIGDKSFVETIDKFPLIFNSIDYSKIPERDIKHNIITGNNAPVARPRTEFEVLTDHKGLTGIFDTQEPTGRIVRWLEKWQHLSPKLIYSPGKDNVIKLSKKFLLVENSLYKRKENLQHVPYVPTEQVDLLIRKYHLKSYTSTIERLSELSSTRKKATEAQKEAARKMISNDKSNVHNSMYKAGLMVLMSNEAKKKLDPSYLGPFRIKYQAPFYTYKLETPKGDKIKNLVHHNRLIPANINSQSTIDLWTKIG
ncbi:hypothetical protein BB561_001692, partial [Smittium simulii]